MIHHTNHAPLKIVDLLMRSTGTRMAMGFVIVVVRVIPLRIGSGHLIG